MKPLTSILYGLALVAALPACHSSGKPLQTEESGIHSLAPNPFITHLYTADPSTHV